MNMLRIKPKVLLLIIGSFFAILSFICSFSKLSFIMADWNSYIIPYFVIFGFFAILYLFFGILFPNKIKEEDAFNTIRFLVVSCLLIALCFVLYNVILYSNPEEVIHHYDLIWIIFFAILWLVNAFKLSSYYKKITNTSVKTNE